MQIAIIKDQHTLFSEAFGYKDREQKIKATPQTQYAIGSVTKCFAATALAMLVDEGLMAWDDTVRGLLPQFQLYDEYTTHNITIRDIASHRTGLPRHDFMRFLNDKSISEIVAILKYLLPNEKIRYKMQYQNHMYVLIAHLLEKLTSKTWHEFIKHRILDKLGMVNTNFSIDAMTASSDYGLPYAGLHDTTPIKLKNIDSISAAAAMNSTAEDMIKWVQLNLNLGSWQGETLVSNKNMKECHAPQTIITSGRGLHFKEIDFEAYGLGWYMETYRGQKVVHHNGNVDGYSAVASFIPHHNIGFAIHTNKSYAKAPLILQYMLYDILLGYTPLNWDERFGQYINTSINKYEAQVQSYSPPPVEKEPTSLNAYLGKYGNPAYGHIAIRLDQGQLLFDYGDLVKHLDQIEKDVFLLTIPVERFVSPIKFEVDNRGQVQSLKIDIEPALNEFIPFYKVDCIS